MSYYISKLFSHIICLLPNNVNRNIGNILGELTWLIVPEKRKKMAVNNILQCLQVTPTEAANIAKKSWTRFGRMIIELLLYPKIKKNIDQYVTLEGKENLERAMSYGKGVVLATSHSGNWEIMGAALALEGFPLNVVAQKQSNQNMDRFINEYREMMGIHVSYKTSMRAVIRLLAKGTVIGMLMDQDAGNDGVILDFFGRKTSCAKGTAFLAHLNTAPIVPIFITENQDGKHTLLIKEPLFIEQTEDKQHDIEKMTEHLTKLIENHIRQYPEEWFWLHDRWKSVEDRD